MVKIIFTMVLFVSVVLGNNYKNSAILTDSTNHSIWLDTHAFSYHGDKTMEDKHNLYGLKYEYQYSNKWFFGAQYDSFDNSYGDDTKTYTVFGKYKFFDTKYVDLGVKLNIGYQKGYKNVMLDEKTDDKDSSVFIMPSFSIEVFNRLETDFFYFKDENHYDVFIAIFSAKIIDF